MRAHIITLFPDSFSSYFSSSILRIAQEKSLFEPIYYNLSSFSDRPQGRVDDAPYGGGPGQLIQVEPVFRAVQHVESMVNDTIPKVFLGPTGRAMTQQSLESSAQEFLGSDVLFLCGHYEGVDARVFDLFDWQQFRVGDYVLSSGELAVMVFVDALVRLFPGVVGNPDSIVYDSFSSEFDGCVEYPQYTRPAHFGGLDVPEILLGGDHKKIEKWRKENIKSSL